jgi:uncharacterized membrane protein
LAILQQLWRAILIGFTISSLYRYLPFLSQGNYDGAVVPNQIMVTWLGGFIAAILIFFVLVVYQNRPHSGRMNT